MKIKLFFLILTVLQSSYVLSNDENSSLTQTNSSHKTPCCIPIRDSYFMIPMGGIGGAIGGGIVSVLTSHPSTMIFPFNATASSAAYIGNILFDASVKVVLCGSLGVGIGALIVSGTILSHLALM